MFAGDFRVIGLIAEGGMGTVYEVEQLSTAKRRALKLVRAPFVGDTKSRERFVREATVGASIDSGHVVEVIGAGLQDEVQPWLAMELLVGGDLGAVVAHNGPLTQAQLLETFRQLCHGLSAAHRAGVVHRDLKPANIFVARPKRAGMPFTVKILDFGIAKVVEGARTSGSQTEMVGSPMWMAPEQLDARRPSARTDVWAVGLIAFWALTGKHYWRNAHKADANVQALFVEQLFKPIDPPTMRAAEYGLPDAIPQAFDAWFAQCTAREEATRFADAAVAFDALAQVLDTPDAETSAAECARLVPEQTLSPSTSAPVEHGTERTVASLGAGPSSAGAPLGYAPTQAMTGAVGAEASQLAAQAPTKVISAQPDTNTSNSTVIVALLLAAVTAAGAVALWLFVRDGTGPGGVDDPADVLVRADRPQSPDNGASPDATSKSAADPAAGAAPPSPAAEADPRPGEPDNDGDGPPQTRRARIEPPAPVSDAVVQVPSAALALVAPMRVQPRHIGRDVDFRGWSADGTRFVVTVTRVDDKGDRLRLTQVHDALTGTVIESYVSNHTASSDGAASSKHTRALEAAGDLQAWRKRLPELDLLTVRPQRRSPNPDLKLEATLGAAPGKTTARITEGNRGFRFRWFDIPTPSTATQGAVKGPELQVHALVGEQRWMMLDSRVPFTVADVAPRRAHLAAGAKEQPAVAGRVDLHWSPDGKRVVVIVETQIEPELADDPARDSRYYLRVAGPQIRILEAGAGQLAARRTALALGKAGFAVAEIELGRPTIAHSKVMHRRSHAGSDVLADTIAAELGGLARERKYSGWTAVSIVLGIDAAR